MEKRGQVHENGFPDMVCVVDRIMLTPPHPAKDAYALISCNGEYFILYTYRDFADIMKVTDFKVRRDPGLSR